LFIGTISGFTVAIPSRLNRVLNDNFSVTEPNDNRTTVSGTNVGFSFCTRHNNRVNRVHEKKYREIKKLKLPVNTTWVNKLVPLGQTLT